MHLKLLSLLHLYAGLLLLLPLSRPASVSASPAAVVTHLPGFDGPLPFHLETGYVEVEEETGTELFYYFVESERSPSTDPLILWLTGGPRCTGFSGFAFEVGPINFVLAPYEGQTPQLEYNPYSWSKMASMLFLDSPCGCGFSYARDPKGYDLGDMSSSWQVVTFLDKWLEDNPRYRSNDFYLGGSSYAGKMIPLIAEYISEVNSGIEQGEQPVINLKGYLVGNPITGYKFDDFNSKIPYSHGVGIISDKLYKAAMDNCKGDYISPRNAMCAGVVNTIANLILEVDHDHILDDKCVSDTPGRVNAGALRNRFLSEEHIQPSEPAPHATINCFSYRYYLAAIWANVNATRDALQIKEGTIGEWTRCTVGLPYTQEVPSSIPYHYNHAIRGYYRVLVFSGDHDPGVPFLGTQRWVSSFNFSILDDWRAWHVDGQSAGFTVAYYNNLTFATVKGGGHTAIRHMPKQGFAMGQRWLENKPL